MTQTDAPIRVAIVDDEAPARSRLRDLLADCAQSQPLEIAGEAANGPAALALLESCAADVVLLDIRMPQMDGIEVAQHLQKLDTPPQIVFTTAYDAYAVQAFELHAIDYLLKPIRAARLLDALKRAHGAARLNADVLMELKSDARTNLSVQERGRIHLIPVGDVIYLQAELKYVTVRTAEREYLLEESLTRLEQEFGDRFVRIHRNCLVARAAIAGFERVADEAGEAHWVVALKGLAEKPAVSRRLQHIVREFGKS
jgi:two-component system response regulator AlgR